MSASHSHRSLFESLIRRVEAGRRTAFCLLVATKGSAPQSPGAAMLVDESLATEGTLGGGCVEAEVRRRAADLLRAGESRLLDFVLDHDFGWDDGLVCGGRMRIAVATVGDETALAPFRAAVAAIGDGRAGVVPVRVADEDGNQLEFHLHAHRPPRLLIAGGGHVGEAVARLAAELDFRVTVIDDRPEFANPERFPPPLETATGDIAETLRHLPVDEATYVVIVTRGHRHDEAALAAVIERPARYVGMIGSRRKIALIFESLAASGVSSACIGRVHAPIGLPIGAVTVKEIAVSIAAELIRERRCDREFLVDGPYPAPAAPGGARRSE